MFDELIKRITSAIRSELEDAGGQQVIPKKLSTRWVNESDASPDLQQQIMDALKQEISAETICCIIEEARERGRRIDPIDLSAAGEADFSRNVRNQVAMKIASASAALGNDVVAIISPTLVTCMGISNLRPAPQYTTMKYLYTLDDVKVFVHPYASDSSPVLFCAKGWVEYSEHDMARASPKTTDPHTNDEIVMFDQPAMLRVNGEKVWVSPITGLSTMGFF